MFTGSTQVVTGTVTTVGLATTYTGLCLSNPANSGKELILVEAGCNVVSAATAASIIGLGAGYVAAGLVTHTTALTVYSNILGIDGDSTHAVSVAKVDEAATLPSTPFLYRTLSQVPITGATAQVVTPPQENSVYRLDGQLIIQPGGYVFIYTQTVLTVSAHFTWAEIVP
jgi:hypothetical protein